MRIRKRKGAGLPARAPESLEPVYLIVMGVTGCGKSTVASALAARIGARYCDGDTLHSAESVAKMRRGEPLTDEDRWPWFSRIAAYLTSGNDSAVIACSALKRAYRDYLRREVRNLRFLFLDASPELTTQRVSARPGHYMPVSLVASQFATLERPENESRVTTVLADTPIDEIVRTFLADLSASATEPDRGSRER